MKFALPTLLTLVVALSACDPAALQLAGSGTSGGLSLTGNQTAAGPDSLERSAVERARPAEIDPSKYTLIIPVDGPDFPHVLFKSPVHAQEAGYCLSSDFGPVTQVIQAADPRTRQSFYFIECAKTDPSLAGLAERIAALEAEQSGWDARTADMRAEAQAAAAAAAAALDSYDDPYADCPVGEGGYPIVRDDCASQ